MSGLSLQGKSNCGKHHHYNATCLRCAEELLAASRKREEILTDLLQRNLERMCLINEGKIHCITGTGPCANHDLIQETEEALRKNK